jgi:membrane-bound serine protease (ClpP class)
MTALGFVLLVLGAALVVAEAHVPGGVLGVVGGVALLFGGIILIGAFGAGAAVAVPVGAGLGAGAVGWGLIVARKASATRRVRIASGPDALCGRIGTVRLWTEPSGQVFVDGALWRARHSWPGRDEAALQEGDPVVVEDVNGLTLSVRRAEEWELPA